MGLILMSIINHFSVYYELFLPFRLEANIGFTAWQGNPCPCIKTFTSSCFLLDSGYMYPTTISHRWYSLHAIHFQSPILHLLQSKPAHHQRSEL